MYINPDSRFWHQIKEKGYFNEFIDFYKSVLMSIQTINNLEEANTKAKEYADRLKKINLDNIFKKIEVDYNKVANDKDNEAMSQKIKVTASYFIPVNGISSNTATQILLTNGINMSYWKAVPFGVYLDLNKMKQI